MTGTEPPFVVVHGGVHKTATSHLQAMLHRNAGRLRKRGVHYIPHRAARKDYTYPCHLNGYQKLGLGFRRKMPDDALQAQARAFFEAVAAGPGERIILSDENMPGHCGQCVRSGDLYQRRDTLVPIFAGHIVYPVHEVHLGLRNYADFFASAYVEYLRSARGAEILGEAAMKRAVLGRMPGWDGLVDAVRASFPDARLILWRHEDFAALAQRIIGNLCGPGIDPAELVAPARVRGRPSASHRAVRELLAEVARVGAEAALARRVEIQERYPRGDTWPGYDPWTADERAHLTRLYARDIADLRARADLDFLCPG
ncbi:hypothetical protein [Roseovarius sp. D22-M7]|uniref:hypothetical protein n=1 Tax=Roseovarius sp. D22-M7 TaxID=3127116 RepID=UPI00300FCAA4